MSHVGMVSISGDRARQSQRRYLESDENQEILQSHSQVGKAQRSDDWPRYPGMLILDFRHTERLDEQGRSVEEPGRIPCGQ